MGAPGYNDLCGDGVQLSFTNFTWPMGVKRDRGFNITFTKDIILQPQGALSGQSPGDSQNNIILSFKDNKNNYRCAARKSTAVLWKTHHFAKLHVFAHRLRLI